MYSVHLGAMNILQGLIVLKTLLQYMQRNSISFSHVKHCVCETRECGKEDKKMVTLSKCDQFIAL